MLFRSSITTKKTLYDVVHNKSGKTVGTATHGGNDYTGPQSSVELTLKNGAQRHVDIWDRERGNPQSALNRFMKDPKTAKKYTTVKEEVVTEEPVSPERDAAWHRWQADNHSEASRGHHEKAHDLLAKHHADLAKWHDNQAE